MIFLLLLALIFLLTPKAVDNTTVIQPSVVVLSIFLPIVAFRIFLGHKKILNSFLIHSFCFFGGILTHCLDIQFSCSIRTSDVILIASANIHYYFFFIILQSLRFNPVYILASTFWSTFFLAFINNLGDEFSGRGANS